MNKLSIEQEKKIKLEVFQNWLLEYRKKNKGANPSMDDIQKYAEELNSRQAPRSPEQLIDLQREETLIRRYAKKIMWVELIPDDSIVINLMPDPGGKTIVKGGHPAIIQLGFTTKEVDFKGDLRRLIRRASKIYSKSTLDPIDKIYEYKKDLREFNLIKEEDLDYYPIIPEDRLQIRIYEVVKVIDLKTGEAKSLSRETEIGQYRHFRNNRLVVEARFHLSRESYANGKLTDEDVTYEKDDGNAKP